AVCQAWGVDTLEPLDGGQGMAFVGGGVVLKPVLDPRQFDWLAGVLSELPPVDDLRIIRPRPAGDGRRAVEGWSAWEYLEGEVDAERWRDALRVSDRFHDIVSGVPWSPAVRGCHRWAIGDAFAWGEADISFPDRFRPLINELTEFCHSVDNLACQLVHGDLGGNIVFHPELAPAVIDVSPYWRPKRYADAIIVADACAWAGADLQALGSFRDPVGVQMIYRAILFRLGAAAIAFDGRDERFGVEVAAYQPVVQALGTAGPDSSSGNRTTALGVEGA
ncbi:MAG: hypothetical protein M3313_13690, partial [Actinomycetota bacterium]|nr:hypothetical protein [Actinomycetota bacterium]